MGRVASMPPFIRLFVCGFWILALMVLLSTVVPGLATEHGRPISIKEAWLNGDALISLRTACVLYGLAALFYLRSPFARPAVLLAYLWIFVTASEWLAGQSLFIDLILGSIPFIMIYLYLYHNRAVQNYFSQKKTIAQQDGTSNGG
jgi:hypothetical protein